MPAEKALARPTTTVRITPIVRIMNGATAECVKPLRAIVMIPHISIASFQTMRVRANAKARLVSMTRIAGKKVRNAFIAAPPERASMNKPVSVS